MANTKTTTEENIIAINNLTKDYGFNRGVFDVSLTVKKGEVYGFLGPNGAGKTTTIRHVMGFLKPETGAAMVKGVTSWKNQHAIMCDIGYLPGEISLPENLTGKQFIKMMSGLRGVTNETKTDYLIKKFKLDITGKLKRMSLGNKRKLALVTAFMHDPNVLVLDEPTSGLDPIMQHEFINFIKEEKSAGKTILLSSHIFSEVESLCDNVSIIKEGRIVSKFHINDIKYRSLRTFKFEFFTQDDWTNFANENKQLKYSFSNKEKLQYKVAVDEKEINDFFKNLSKWKIKYLSEDVYTLEDYFMSFYEKGKV